MLTTRSSAGLIPTDQPPKLDNINKHANTICSPNITALGKPGRQA
jgi:hypothetical protein